MRLQYHCSMLAVLVSALGSAVAAEPSSKEIEANGITMSYIEEGTGEPIVFVHGAVSDDRAWKPIRAEISDEHHFLAVTLRCHGTGRWPDKGENFSPATFGDDVATFIEVLGVGPVHLVAWSYGGRVVATAALENPDMVQSLTLFEGAPLNLVEDNEANDAAWEAVDRMEGPMKVAMEEGDVEKATRAMIEGVFQMEPGGFESQPRELKEMQLENARMMPLFGDAPNAEFT